MSAIAVTAVGTEVGKTFVACGLIRALRAQGRAVDAFKPVLSGFGLAEGSDAGLLLAALGRPLSDLDRMSPLRFAAPLAPPSAARAEGVHLSLDGLARLCRGRMGQASETLLVIEGAGGVMSPIAEDATNLDLFAELGLAVVLVTGSYLGAVSHTLTALAALRERSVAVLAIVVSESEGDAPPTEEIASALTRFAADMPVFIAPRGQQWDASALADAL